MNLTQVILKNKTPTGLVAVNQITLLLNTMHAFGYKDVFIVHGYFVAEDGR